MGWCKNLHIFWNLNRERKHLAAVKLPFGVKLYHCARNFYIKLEVFIARLSKVLPKTLLFSVSFLCQKLLLQLFPVIPLLSSFFIIKRFLITNI
jgi:hypothetical protein